MKLLLIALPMWSKIARFIEDPLLRSSFRKLNAVVGPIGILRGITFSRETLSLIEHITWHSRSPINIGECLV